MTDQRSLPSIHDVAALDRTSGGRQRPSLRVRSAILVFGLVTVLAVVSILLALVTAKAAQASPLAAALPDTLLGNLRGMVEPLAHAPGTPWALAALMLAIMAAMAISTGLMIRKTVRHTPAASARRSQRR
jgi:hypothetical protein